MWHITSRGPIAKCQMNRLVERLVAIIAARPRETINQVLPKAIKQSVHWPSSSVDALIQLILDLI